MLDPQELGVGHQEERRGLLGDCRDPGEAGGGEEAWSPGPRPVVQPVTEELVIEQGAGLGEWGE